MAWVKCEIRVLGILDRINNQLLVLKSILLRGVGPLIQQLRPDPTCLLPSRSGPFPSSFMLSCSAVSDSVTPWTVTRQAPLSMGFPRQEYWSGVPFPSQGIFATQGSNPSLLRLWSWQMDSLPPGKPFFQLGSEGCSVVSNPLQPHGLCCPWNSPGQILEWVAFPFSRGSSQPRGRT